MAVLKIRGDDGVIREVVSIKGEPGSGGASNAKEVAYDGSEQYIGGSTVEEALNNVSNYIAGFNSHVHNAIDVGCKPYDRDIRTVDDALDHLFAEVDGFSEALDELHAYAQGLVNGGAAE